MERNWWLQKTMQVCYLNLFNEFFIILICNHNVSYNKCTWLLKNVADGINETEKSYLKGEMELIDKLTSNDIPNIEMLPSAPKGVSINFSEQCLQIITNNNLLNGMKVSTKIQRG